MNRKLLFAAIAIAVAPIIVYFLFRIGTPFSFANSDWTYFAAFAGIAAVPINILVLWVLLGTLQHAQEALRHAEKVSIEQYDRAEFQHQVALIRGLHDSINRHLDTWCVVQHGAGSHDWPVRAHLGLISNGRGASPGYRVFDELIVALNTNLQELEMQLATLRVTQGETIDHIRGVYSDPFDRYREAIKEHGRKLDFHWAKDRVNVETSD